MKHCAHNHMFVHKSGMMIHPNFDVVNVGILDQNKVSKVLAKTIECDSWMAKLVLPWLYN